MSELLTVNDYLYSTWVALPVAIIAFFVAFIMLVKSRPIDYWIMLIDNLERKTEEMIKEMEEENDRNEG